MKVLIIKMSSLGDILHTLPALTDAGQMIPGIKFDWVVESAFAEIPAWHPLVHQVIPIAFRKMRKTPIKSLFSQEWREFRAQLKTDNYDLVIDAQGLLKSAWIASMARGPKAGLDKHSAWEPIASLFYQKKYSVNPDQHAVDRVRQLFAQVLKYSLPKTIPDYGISRAQFGTEKTNSIIFLHATTWQTKLWPERYWQQLANLIATAGYQIQIPWGNVEERQRAERMAANCSAVQVLPKLNLTAISKIIATAQAVVAVDTGLGHVAAALGVPTISLYGPTDPKQTGTVGNNQVHLAAEFACAPCLQRVCTYKQPSEHQPACFTKLPPMMVWQRLQELIRSRE